MQKAIILLAFLLLSFSTHAQPATTKYGLLKNESQLLWKASYIIGGGHEGTLSFKSGSLTNSNGAFKGDFILDMNSIHNTDISPEEDRKGLEEHLRSGDFFSTQMYPDGFFSIIKTTPLENQDYFTVVGFLTLKGLTNEITFPANIITQEGGLKVQAEINIDRTRWGVNYQSKSVFTALKEGVISDQIKVSIDLSFKKLN